MKDSPPVVPSRPRVCFYKSSPNFPGIADDYLNLFFPTSLNATNPGLKLDKKEIVVSPVDDPTEVLPPRPLAQRYMDELPIGPTLGQQGLERYHPSRTALTNSWGEPVFTRKVGTKSNRTGTVANMARSTADRPNGNLGPVDRERRGNIMAG